MHFDIITLFPSVFSDYLQQSIIKHALNNKQITINIINLRDYSKDRHHKVDDTVYGGGAGMLINYVVCYDCITDLISKASIKTKKYKVVYMSPQGKVLTQNKVKSTMKKYDHIIILCGHYEGIDERVLTLIDEEVSIGDYVLTGGELPALVYIDSLSRMLDGVINEESKTSDSLYDGLLKYPQYTKPRIFNNLQVPDILLSGDHKKIGEYRREMQLRNTYLKRKDLLKKVKLTDKDLEMISKIKKEINIK